MRFPLFFGRTFLTAGNAPACQSVTDGLCHGLPPLSNSLIKCIFASQLSLPPPLDPQSLQVCWEVFYTYERYIVHRGFCHFVSIWCKYCWDAQSSPALPSWLASLRSQGRAVWPHSQLLSSVRVNSKLLNRLIGAKLICSQLVAKPTFDLFHSRNNESNYNT